ncbi:alpha-tubulin N-acetyltransferase 1 isoform X3 [Leuresthes tenuis]|uniref:alpha-tubulin N-acetyltransferase 1 isoform X3 n=1 Tax=Leuresthes tenuis TaxID=355514 RepID=UPI003B501A91
MEFTFDINQLFSERISVLDHSLVAGRKSAGRADLQAHIATVIDELGRASAKAQRLSAPITSASKLQAQKHQLYLLKAGESSGGREVVVGFLKVGYKKLFLLDRHGVHVEAEPLCVLDFFIAENLQRHGYGLELFDFMLQHKNLKPVLMAYDRPSPKFLSFLGKHYCLTQSVPQVNNFVVFDGFFLNKAVVRQEQRTLPWPFAPPHSPQLSRPLSVESSPSRATPRSTRSFSPGGNKEQNTQSAVMERCRERHSSQGGLAARSSLYSRHMDSGAVGLLNRHLPGLRPVADQTCALGYTDTHRLASIHTTLSRSQPLWSPLLPASERNGRCSQTSVESRDKVLDTGATSCVSAEIKLMDSQQTSAGAKQPPLLETERARNGRGWSWTVGENCSTVQWVKQKQEYRSTRPW